MSQISSVAVEVLVPAYVPVPATSCGAAKAALGAANPAIPIAEIEAPVRKPIRREMLVIINPLFF
jgi:hypothetical protein